MKKNRVYHHKPRMIYLIEFPNKSVYVGLTAQIKRRIKDHRNASNNKYLRENFIIFGDNFKIKCNGILYSEKEAQYLEEFHRNKYEKKGWKVLNIAKTGSLGGGKIFWTFKRCLQEAKKYRTRGEFQKAIPSAYTSARKNNWIEKICKHMDMIQRPRDYWTLKKVLKEAKKYKYYKDFRKNSCAAEQAAIRNKWTKEVYRHLKRIKQGNGHWDFKNCKKEAQKYKSRREFCKKSGGAYNKSQKPIGYWNDFSNCKREAAKYKTRTEFKTGSSRAYKSSRDNGWLEEILSHIPPLCKKPFFWNKDKCEMESKNRTLFQFRKEVCGAYKASLRNGWLKEFYPSK